jgi:hypothetical protein
MHAQDTRLLAIAGEVHGIDSEKLFSGSLLYSRVLGLGQITA